MKKLIFQAPQNFTATTSSQKMLDADPRRTFVEFVNLHLTQKAFIAYGSNPAELNKGTVLMPNGGVVTLTPEYARSTQQVNVIAEGNTIIAIQVGK